MANLTIYQLKNKSPWYEVIPEALQKLTLTCTQPRNSINFFDKENVHKFSDNIDNLNYSNGFSIHKESLKGLENQVYLTILPKIIYLNDEFKQIFPDSIDSTKILEPIGNRIKNIHKLAKELSKLNIGFHSDPVNIQFETQNVQKSTKYIIGPNRIEEDIGGSLPMHTFRKGYINIPESLKIYIPKTQDKTPYFDSFCNSLSDELIKRKQKDKIVFLDEHELEEKLSRLERNAEKHIHGHLFLLFLKGHKGDAVEERVGNIMARLDKLKFPYSLDSMDNDQSQATINVREQLGFLTNLSGGISYELNLPFPDQNPDYMFIGIDLGHHREQSYSTVVFSLVDHTGNLKGFFSKKQIRNETVDRDILKDGLNWCQKKGSQRKFIIFRDGRLFMHETIEQYKNIFGNNFTLVEIAKRDSPLLIDGNNPAKDGTIVQPVNSSHYFLLTTHNSSNSKHITAPLKIHIQHDGLNLKSDTIIKLIQGLCYAPTRGFKSTRLPSPIYWADGIAAIGKTNHQFSGMHHVENG